MTNNYLISIVTVVYNNSLELDNTIKNIIAQTYKNIEFIIVDGGSTDDTIGVIKKYENNVSKWISESDEGIYDAMNKGVSLANGDFVVFMNAGDKFYNNQTLEKCVNKFNSANTTYFGRAKVIKINTSWLYPNMDYTIENIQVWLSKNLPNHQAMFFPKSFYKNYLYNLEYKIGSDSDYKFQANTDVGFTFIDEIICSFEWGGVSSEFNSLKNTKQILKDSWKISMKHEGFNYALERQIKIITKFFISKILGAQILKNILFKLRK